MKSHAHPLLKSHNLKKSSLELALQESLKWSCFIVQYLFEWNLIYNSFKKVSVHKNKLIVECIPKWHRFPTKIEKLTTSGPFFNKSKLLLFHFIFLQLRPNNKLTYFISSNFSNKSWFVWSQLAFIWISTRNFYFAIPRREPQNLLWNRRKLHTQTQWVGISEWNERSNIINSSTTNYPLGTQINDFHYTNYRASAS